ncbi:MAG: UDP-galactopyranose mutase, partial [Bacteroidetes bacterium]|nr:UDP-galactopyranose mutase [Bacteroidota bacterium]
MHYHFLIVGAGFAGCILAERLATQRNKKVLLIDRRNHVGGNAYDVQNEEGILIHRYGPHLFHTNDEHVFAYLSQFTEWRAYEHRVLSSVNGKLVPIPINRITVNELFNLHLQNDDEVKQFFEREKETITAITNSEEYVTSRVGKRLFRLLYKGYTRKQWGREPKELAPSVCGRIPIRLNTDSRYFDDCFQGVPKEGYTKMFERMIAHSNIHLSLSTEYKEVPSSSFHHLIYTGPIDEYFDYEYGKLPYRSLNFEHETIDAEYFQSAATVNFPNSFDYTRINEWKHITGQKHSKTAITREYPQAEGDPYYPIPTLESEQQ